MEDPIRKIKFKGQPYILVGEAITTEELYQKGHCSYAYLMDTGEVFRFGRVIGTKDDIEFGETIEVHGTLEGLINMLLGNTWPRTWGKP